MRSKKEKVISTTTNVVFVAIDIPITFLRFAEKINCDVEGMIMKRPKPTLLTRDTIEELKEDGLDPLYIEFLGTKTGYANAVNNPYPGQRCIKAALTILSRSENVKWFKLWAAKRLRPEQAPGVDLSEMDAALAEVKQAKEAIERDRAEQWQEEHLPIGFGNDPDEGEEE